MTGHVWNAIWSACTACGATREDIEDGLTPNPCNADRAATEEFRKRKLDEADERMRRAR